MLSDLSCHISHYMGNSTTCEHTSITTYYLLLPLFIIALFTLFIVHEYRWGTSSRIRTTYQPISIPLEHQHQHQHQHVTLSSLSTKKRRMMKKDEKEDVMEKMEIEKEIVCDGKKEDMTFPDIKKPAMIPTRITLVDESGTSSTFPIPSADTTFHDILSLYASTHHLTLDHLILLHNNMILSLSSTPTSYGIHDTDIIHIQPHYKNIFEYKRNIWNMNKNQLESKISKLRADLMIVEDMAQQRASQLIDLQSRYDTIFKELSHLKSTSHMSGQHSPILESMNGDVEMWKEKVAILEKELIDALKWKTQCKTLEREAKEAQRWKSVVKQGRLREKSLERDVKEMHHWRQRARAFEKEVKELRLFKRHVMSRYGIDERAISQTGKDTTPPRTNGMISSDMTITARMTTSTPTPPLSARTNPSNMTPLNVHAIQQQQQQQHLQQQQQHVLQHPHTRILQQQYPNILHHFPTVIPNHTSSQSVPVTARGIPTSTTQNLPSPPISQSVIGTQHSRRLTIGSSTTHIPSSVTWTPSLSTPLFSLSDSTPSSTVTSPQLSAHTIPSPLVDAHDDTDYISGLVLDDDGYNSETEQLPLNLSSDDGSENERTGEEEA